jgi:hypothetical protein
MVDGVSIFLCPCGCEGLFFLHKKDWRKDFRCRSTGQRISFKTARPFGEKEWERCDSFRIMYFVVNSRSTNSRREALLLIGIRHLEGDRFGDVPTIDEVLRNLAPRCSSPTWCDLIREIYGNPFWPVFFDSAWRTSNVVDLAQTIYDEQAFDRLPILLDALMDAGCNQEEILNHCRQPEDHVRGCWVLDLERGKE